MTGVQTCALPIYRINITAFESNEDSVKIKSDSSDYNEIVLEVAKQFTIINNTDPVAQS